ncbi:hypothetical protein MTO96_032310 [Rhipicephalus appendiculatus]
MHTSQWVMLVFFSPIGAVYLNQPLFQNPTYCHRFVCPLSAPLLTSCTFPVHITVARRSVNCCTLSARWNALQDGALQKRCMR